jgi:hypothetical protein
MNSENQSKIKQATKFLTLLIVSGLGIFALKDYLFEPELQDLIRLTQSAPISSQVIGAELPEESGRKLKRTNRRDLLTSIQSKYGDQLKFEFAYDTLLSSIENLSRVPQQRAAQPYDSNNPEYVSSRASEILEDLRAVFPLHQKLPLKSLTVQTGPGNAQVYYQQNYENIPIEPYGKVTLMLGPQGEFLALHSDYLPSLELRNQRSLTDQQAKVLLMKYGKDEKNPRDELELGSLRQIIWITSLAGNGKAAQGLFAYEGSVQGRQIIVDSQSGELLLRKDRKKF